MELRSTAYTVVVANDDDDGMRAHVLAQHWHEDGLLNEFAWVTPSDVTATQHGPVSVSARVFGHEGQVELMALLGARSRSLVRIVVLHLLTHEDSSAHRLVEACDQISDLVTRAMPRRLDDDGNQAGMRLLRVNLLVPESDLLPQDVNLIEPGWEINAIVSPEDRPDLDRMSIFVRQSANLHGHGLAAAAAVGGLWKGSPIGAFDSHETDSTTGGREVLVIRCQARIVVGDDRSTDLAEQVVSTVQGSDMGAAPFVPWGLQAENSETLVQGVIKKLVESPGWAPVTREIHPLEKTQVPLGTLVKNWSLFQVQLPVVTVKYLLGRGRSVVEQSLTAATVGRGAGQVGRLQPLSPDQARRVAEFQIQQLVEQLEPARLHDEASKWGSTLPATWRELRELAIGLVDGSRLPDAFSRTQRDGLDEVLPPHAVVPAPDDVLQLSGRPRLQGIDVAAVAEVAQQIADQGDDAEPEDKASPGQPVSVEPSEPTDTERLTAWVEKRKHSLLWSLSSRAYDLRRQEVGRANDAHAALSNSQPPSTTRLKSAQRLVIVSWLLTFLACGLLALMAWAAGREDPVRFLAHLPDLNWANISKVVAAVLIVLLLAGTYYFQTLRAYEWERDRRMHALRTASDDYVASRQQERRWAHVLRGLQDWGAILAEVLHRPWASSKAPDPSLGGYDGLPAGVAVATPINSNALSDPRVVAKGVEAACQRGWIAEEFERMVTLSPRNDPRAQPHAGDLPADLDPGVRAHGPRMELVEVAAAGSTKEAAKRHLVYELIELVSEGDVTMPPQTVVRLGNYSDGEPIIDREFLATSIDIQAPFAHELFHPDALVARHNHPDKSFYCLPVGSPSPSRDNVEVHHYGVSTAVRVDISPHMSASSVRLFDRTHRREPTPLESVDEFN